MAYKSSGQRTALSHRIWPNARERTTVDATGMPLPERRAPVVPEWMPPVIPEWRAPATGQPQQASSAPLWQRSPSAWARPLVSVGLRRASAPTRQQQQASSAPMWQRSSTPAWVGPLVSVGLREASAAVHLRCTASKSPPPTPHAPPSHRRLSNVARHGVYHEAALAEGVA